MDIIRPPDTVPSTHHESLMSIIHGWLIVLYYHGADDCGRILQLHRWEQVSLFHLSVLV
jgi:hypothetical protein